MAANTTPIFIKQGNFTPARIAALNSVSDGSGTLVTLVSGATDGTRVEGVRFRNAQASNAASTAMMHRIFLSDTAGTNYKLIGEVATPAATRSNTVAGATSVFIFDYPIIMKSGQIMSVCQSAFTGGQDQFDACAFAGDF